MARLNGLRLLVAGAGAVGSVLALRLRQEGADVVLADPAALADNASGVAAGMLAPAFEAVLDPASAGHFGLYLAARDLWPALAQALEPHGARLDRSGALWAGAEPTLASMRARLEAAGARAEILGAAAAQALSPGLIAPAGGVFTPDDWRIEARPALEALSQAFLEAGGRRLATGLRRVSEGEAMLGSGETLKVDEVILATGLPPASFEQAPAEVARLSPIKGQIARLPGLGPAGGPVVRGEGVYVVPTSSGALAGATMEPGVSNRRVDTEVLGRLTAAAAALFPALAGTAPTGAAGVRAATPDGLPLVGPSRTRGVRLALGARRNGWLLAPLIAETIVAQLAGEAPGPFAAALDPARFGD